MLIKLDKIKISNNSNLGMVNFFVAGTNLDFEKVSKYGIFFGPYFPVFGLNMEVYGVKPLLHGVFSLIT